MFITEFAYTIGDQSRAIYVGGHGFECPPGSREVTGQLKRAVFVLARPGTKGCVYISRHVCSVATRLHHSLSPKVQQQDV